MIPWLIKFSDPNYVGHLQAYALAYPHLAHSMWEAVYMDIFKSVVENCIKGICMGVLILLIIGPAIWSLIK